jgi:hypothetical protein
LAKVEEDDEDHVTAAAENRPASAAFDLQPSARDAECQRAKQTDTLRARDRPSVNITAPTTSANGSALLHAASGAQWTSPARPMKMLTTTVLCIWYAGSTSEVDFGNVHPSGPR